MKKESRTISQRLDKFLESSQRKSYFVAFGTFAFLLIFLIFAVIPAFSSVIGQNEENQKIASEIAKARDKLKAFETLNAQKEQKATSLELFEKAFASKDPQGEIVGIISNSATSNTINIRSIQFPEKYKRPKLIGIDFPGLAPQIASGFMILSIEGDRQNIYELIKDMEESRLVFNFLRAAVSRKTDKALESTADRGEFTAQFEIEYFYYDVTKVSQ